MPETTELTGGFEVLAEMNTEPKAASSRGDEGADDRRELALVPMTFMDANGILADPLTVAIAHAFEVYDLDAIEAQDGDMLRGLARLAGYVAARWREAHVLRAVHHEGVWSVNTETGECGCECPRCYVDDECACPDCTYDHDHSRRRQRSFIAGHGGAS